MFKALIEVASRAELPAEERTISPLPYRLDRCQINTPDEIVRGFWDMYVFSDFGNIIGLN